MCLKEKLVIATLLMHVIITGCTTSQSVEEIAVTEHLRFEHRTWYQDTIAGPALVSLSGRYLLYYREIGWLLYDKQTKKSVTVEEITGYDSAPLVNWLPGDRLEFKGRKDGELNREVFNLVSGEMEESPMPRNSWLMRTSSDEQVLLGWQIRDKKAGLYAEDKRDGTVHLILDSFPLSYEISPDGSAVYYFKTEGDWAALYRYILEKKEHVKVIDGLDTTYQSFPSAVGPDNRTVYYSLVAAVPGNLEDKHRPDTDRDLDIWAIDGLTGDAEIVAATPKDDLVSGIADGQLYWTAHHSDMNTVTLPTGGGEMQQLTERQTTYPYWHPSGKKVSVMWGEWHIADWALNWDIAAIDVNDNGEPAGKLTPLLQGFHEDFNLSWSPDGKWMAYHSHRSDHAVTSYSAKGSTDAIWLREAGGGDEIKLSSDEHFEVLQGEWAPDGRRLIFCSLGNRRPYRPFIITIDPATGKALSEEMFHPEAIENGVFGANWSPARPELFLEERVSNKRHALWRVNEDGSEVIKLIEFDSLIEFGGLDVSTDGEKVYFAQLVDGHHQLFEMSREGGESRQLTSGDSEVILPQVSPDGKRIAASRYAHEKIVHSIPVTIEQ